MVNKVHVSNEMRSSNKRVWEVLISPSVWYVSEYRLLLSVKTLLYNMQLAY